MRGMDNLKAMLSPEKLMASLGIDGDAINAMFASQLTTIKTHFEQYFEKIANSVQSGQDRQLSQFVAMMDSLERIETKLSHIEMSLVKTDPTYVSLDFLKENGLPLDTMADSDPEDTRAVSIPISSIPVWNPKVEQTSHE